MKRFKLLLSKIHIPRPKLPGFVKRFRQSKTDEELEDFEEYCHTTDSPAEDPAAAPMCDSYIEEYEEELPHPATDEPDQDIYYVKPPSIFEWFPLFTLPIIRQILFFFRVLGWILIDIFRAIIRRRDRKIHLYGIWCFVGLPGAGKTMSLVHYLDEQRRFYGDQIIIITNFYYAGQDAQLTGWDMLLKEYDKPVIFAWDELQNEFNSREYRKFPMRLVHELTQNRKGNGKQVVYTTQTFTAVDNNFRNLTYRVVDCRTHFGRVTTCRHYKREFYEARIESKSIERKVRIKPIRKQRFIQTDYLRSRYDSFQRLDYLKNLNYIGLTPDIKPQ